MSTTPKHTPANPTDAELTLVQHMVAGFTPKLQIPTDLGGYEMHKIVNQLLRDAGITKQIPPQMMYNYLKKGYLTPATFPEWVLGYIERTVKRAS